MAKPKSSTQPAAVGKAKRRTKVGGGPSPVEHVKVITSTGRVRWDVRPRQGRTK